MRGEGAAVRGPEFVGLFSPVIDTLRDLGDSGKPKEVSELIAKRLKISDEELSRTNKRGQSRFENQVHWARFYLAKAGLIDMSRRGVWTLTKAGREARMDHQQALSIFNEVHQKFPRGTPEPEPEGTNEYAEAPPDEQTRTDRDFRTEMVDMLQSLSADGFERLCMLVLREVGFEEVTVTGRSGDGGIDGIGTLRVNPLASDRVVFQCKKHTRQISPNYVREFRGSMDGRATRGIFLATSTFSAEARREAERLGVAPIEMVDLDRLIGLMKDVGLGVVARQEFSVDHEFFRDYTAENRATPSARQPTRRRT